MSSWGGSACYPRSTFYPLSDGVSIHIRRITMPQFPACSACLPPSQAPLCHCTLLGRLPIGPRAPLEASVTLLEATTPVKLPTTRCPLYLGLDPRQEKGRISTMAPRFLAKPNRSLRPILHVPCPGTTRSCSKGSRGLSVPSRVPGIFTGTTISPSSWSRQCPDRYTIRAGRNLPDKEFRYLRTVIVTAAVYRGFNSNLLVSDELSS